MCDSLAGFYAEGPYFFADLAGTSEAEEQGAIDAGQIQAGRHPLCRHATLTRPAASRAWRARAMSRWPVRDTGQEGADRSNVKKRTE